MQIPLSYICSLYEPSVAYIRKIFACIPEITVIAGSGIGEVLDQYEPIDKISYNSIPDFPKSTVEGHNNELIVSRIRNEPVLIFSGRFHLYEGKTLSEICAPVVISHKLGIKKIIILNAAGGLNAQYSIGNLMLIRDSINFTAGRIIHMGLRANFHNGSHYSPEWLDNISRSLVAQAISHYDGVYACVGGPSYETPAEIRMYRKSADAIGMSTYHEAHAANLLGIDLAGCSIITNALKENNTETLDHKHVLAEMAKASERLRSFIECAVRTKQSNDKQIK